MKAKILTNSNSKLTMFRLGAVDGELVEDNDFDEKFILSTKEENLAILIITRSLYDNHALLVDDFRKDNVKPLIVIIDD